MALRLLIFFGTLCLLAGCARADLQTAPLAPPIPVDAFLSDATLTEKVLKLDALRLSAEDVLLLSRCPAPRILAFNGSAFNTMDSFSRFLIRMGYPETSLRDPSSGSLSYSSYRSGKKIAQDVLAFYEKEGLRPILIGHSQGGARVVQALHELRTLRLGYASAVATGKWMRVVLGQWDMVPTLRKVPDSVEEFTGYRIAGDWIGSDMPFVKEAGDYEAQGSAQVRNVLLRGAGHLDLTRVEGLAAEAASRDRIETYAPSAQPVPDDARLFFAADIWYHVKKHWCLELQRSIRAHRRIPTDAP